MEIVALGDQMQLNKLKRREFLAAFGGTTLCGPLAARRQQPAVPVIGFLRKAPISGRG